ncbi:uncharacterized protein Dana_GF21480, isoform B [Drosophila ananassae]|uniref:Uncharacterized protein, isoform B n=1 Tax=Drosophila ananassae TaxID=7217 RepID=A0A0P8XKE3_DROAN|nr:uncharacterized protein LOC6504162 isoform X1 [Drosophila ananassae]KPU75265.1 uncharacterized protein Dana_GF21480, isoform B [Drosophila ananassae]
MSARRQSFENTDDVSTDEFEPPQRHELIRSAPSNNLRSGVAPQQYNHNNEATSSTSVVLRRRPIYNPISDSSDSDDEDLVANWPNTQCLQRSGWMSNPRANRFHNPNRIGGTPNAQTNRFRTSENSSFQPIRAGAGHAQVAMSDPGQIQRPVSLPLYFPETPNRGSGANPTEAYLDTEPSTSTGHRRLNPRVLFPCPVIGGPFTSQDVGTQAGGFVAMSRCTGLLEYQRHNVMGTNAGTQVSLCDSESDDAGLDETRPIEDPFSPGPSSADSTMALASMSPKSQTSCDMVTSSGLEVGGMERSGSPGRRMSVDMPPQLSESPISLMEFIGSAGASLQGSARFIAQASSSRVSSSIFVEDGSASMRFNRRRHQAMNYPGSKKPRKDQTGPSGAGCSGSARSRREPPQKYEDLADDSDSD